MSDAAPGVLMDYVPDVTVGRAQAEHEKPQEGVTNVTDVTDVTPNRKGCTWRASAGERPRPLGLLDTPLSNGVTSVTSVTWAPQSCGLSVTPNRNIVADVTGHDETEAKA
jgi:hypothetical protein